MDIKYVQIGDKEFRNSLDRHLPESEFEKKVRDNQGYQMVMTSTQIDEEAQHFYRKLGYIDCGNLTIDYPGLAQPMELLLSKEL
ncbi:MAG: hypothetical protein J6U54_22260 [Clostridiales bacterium]|nr:hypothetical protein [Clostridiales bacterium]